MSTPKFVEKQLDPVWTYAP